MSQAAKTTAPTGYNIGDSDQRPWGHYRVINIGVEANGEEFCEKEITVNPGQILSLQSHELRREIWTVLKGTLEVIVDEQRLSLEEGQSVLIPLKAIHCMANAGKISCVVHERQIGKCSEEDIIRYVDAYGRNTLDLDEKTEVSVDLFHKLKKQISS